MEERKSLIVAALLAWLGAFFALPMVVLYSILLAVLVGACYIILKCMSTVIEVKKVSEHSLKVGNKIVQLTESGEVKTHSELTQKESDALQAWMINNTASV